MKHIESLQARSIFLALLPPEEENASNKAILELSLWA